MYKEIFTHKTAKQHTHLVSIQSSVLYGFIQFGQQIVSAEHVLVPHTTLLLFRNKKRLLHHLHKITYNSTQNTFPICTQYKLELHNFLQPNKTPRMLV